MKLSVMWKNGYEVTTRTVFRAGHILDDIRRSMPKHPLGHDVYWRDDVFDPEIFHAHHKIKSPFESLGESIGTAYVVKD